VLLLGIVAVTLLLVVVVADVGSYVTARARAAAAADAAALAAAPVTFRPFGAAGGPRNEASRFAASNGARLVSCRCGQDPSFEERVVEVEVEVPARTILFGSLPVWAASRAEFRPVRTQPIGGP
jgi:secretion/DNA translocation related TadE-like protein